MSPFTLITWGYMVLLIASGFLLSGQQIYWLLAVTLPVYLLLLFFGVTRLSMGYFGPAFCRNKKAGKKVALTFDDGPELLVTPKLLDLLQQHRVPAAFFVTGQRAKNHPEIIRQMVAAGHIVGNHTYHHFWYTNLLGQLALEDEIATTSKLLAEITGQPVKYFRPPVGLYNNIVARVVKKLGLTCVGFSAGRFDQKAQDGAALAQRLLQQTENGAVIVLHDGGRKDPEVLLSALELYLTGLEKAGYQVVSLEELQSCGKTK